MLNHLKLYTLKDDLYLFPNRDKVNKKYTTIATLVYLVWQSCKYQRMTIN